tara:strand:- start:327 stop:1337 length:1011 start_codon:yes stop_codon:yes gene_type:complete
MSLKDISKLDFESALKVSLSKEQLLKNLNWPRSGRYHKICSQKILEWKLDVSHFMSGPERNRKYPLIKKKCPVCQKEFEVSSGHPKEKKTCSGSCGNKFSKKDGHKEETKKKISQALLKKYGGEERTEEKKAKYVSKLTAKCAICQKEFKSAKKPYGNQKCCSRGCGQVYQFGSLPLTEEETKNKIAELALSGDWQKRKAGSKLIHSATRFFGSWNKAIKECGLEPNKQVFVRKKIKCSDGHIVDSLSERIIDEYLNSNGIKHEIQKDYPNSNWVCDFYLTELDIYVEYFGLYEVDEYKEVADKKIKFCKDEGIKLIQIYPSDLYPSNRLDEIFNG